MGKQPKMTQMGRQEGIPESPETHMLEVVPNEHPDMSDVEGYTSAEFSAL